jgi:hypothetical protein
MDKKLLNIREIKYFLKSEDIISLKTLVPEHNGDLLINDAGTIFLIDEGKKRGFTNYNTFRNLIKDNPIVHPEHAIELITTGRNIPDDAITVRNLAGTIFVLDRDSNDKTIKRGIPSLNVLNHYQFRWPPLSNPYEDSYYASLISMFLNTIPDGPIFV